MAKQAQAFGLRKASMASARRRRVSALGNDGLTAAQRKTLADEYAAALSRKPSASMLQKVAEALNTPRVV